MKDALEYIFHIGGCSPARIERPNRRRRKNIVQMQKSRCGVVATSPSSPIIRIPSKYIQKYRGDAR